MACEENMVGASERPKLAWSVAAAAEEEEESINRGTGSMSGLPGYHRWQTLRTQLETFILDFRLDNNFVYRDQLRENALLKKYYCDVNINDLINFNEELAHKLASEPAEIIPLFESALKKCTHRIVFPHEAKVDLPDHQLLLHSDADDVSIRNLDSMTIARLVRVPGIVIGASVMSSKATELHIQCRNCQHQSTIPVLGGFTGVSLPRQCERKRVPNDHTPKCPLDPYFVMHEKSRFVDQQIIKLQEAPDQVPVGELPRHVLISADRYLTNRVVPGSRCTVMGIFSIYQNKASKNSSTGGAVAIRTPYLRAVGIHTDMDKTAKGAASYTEEEEQEFLELSRRPDLYNIMADCIAPSIYGNRDIKKAILCLLLGGSKKILPDGMRLRGDINVLLLGDPGTAKSQLLKFVERAAPISIYTSGKGSSAAGLTASVQRDQSTREFYLEGGAMVLADGGVVCIDEFDKMRDEDRVAIHEAMEQQTISIAKAGITTILNARTSVLAAANPIFGRYDDMKTPGENIDFQTTILSRFDMIFIVKDEHTREKDERIAKHVMGIHMDGRGAEEIAESEIPVDKMRRYLTYCKTLSEEAATKLSSHFVAIRRQVHAAEMEANTRSSIPITVRQLEAIVRITESLAKLTLSPIATEEHVDEAIRLFLCSTMDAVNQGSNQGSRELNEEVNRLEVELKRRLPIGWSTSLATLRREMVEGKGYSEQGLNRALMILQRRDTIMFRNSGAQVYRNGA
ncbi:DNA replication licensing factor mcm5 [Purpureocillium lavendulum]|uniref:DNA replication licensing factor MCM5 n=1 Tax=Purpureocillium lavendulum TaxID=1247861 RepID=A0AB34FIC8_9HYPO|nr:DNA replication licensing factor mcm5 [Purpureocillium lavendulum]